MNGLYIHIPFCESKCDYCDFYSFVPSENQKDEYLKAAKRELVKYSSKIRSRFDSIYFGGGTPSFFGAERIVSLLETARKCFDFSNSCEITVECNPSSSSPELMKTLYGGGVNRISLGMQSANESERRLISRRSTPARVEAAVEDAKKAGIKNISLDLMLAIPSQTTESLDESLSFVLSRDITHVSAYMLKVEPNTPLFKKAALLSFPNEDEACRMYLQTVSRLEENGFLQYEISNFAKPGFESRHNKKYWLGDDYLGIGPSAHSLIEGKRFFYPRNFGAFLSGAEPIFDDVGGTQEEFVMLRLRLKSGLSKSEFEKKFAKPLPSAFFEKAREFEKFKKARVENDRICLTPEGFLISNYIIEEFLELLD